MTTSREQFEARYPIPAGVEWSTADGRYQPLGGKYVTGLSLRVYEGYVSAWGVWRASREDVVVTLPEAYCWDNDGGFEREYDPESECSMALIPRIDARHAIESAGLRVSP